MSGEVDEGDVEALGDEGFGEVLIGVRAKDLGGEGLGGGGFVGVCLDLDGAVIGVVVAKGGGGEGEEPVFGVLGAKGGGGEDEEESEKGDKEGEVELEGEGIVVGFGG